jgi:hypothetical protein
MNGATVMDSDALGSVPTIWSIIGTGDFNGDGKTDILWRDTAEQTTKGRNRIKFRNPRDSPGADS